jgi:Family of unknown function (DUF5681)
MGRRPTNPRGIGGFKPGQSGNPGGRPRKHVGDLGAAARLYAGLALETIVQICGNAKADRDRLAAARELLDRGFGRSVQAIDLVLMGRKITELSRDELVALDALLASAAAVGTEESPGPEALN